MGKVSSKPSRLESKGPGSGYDGIGTPLSRPAKGEAREGKGRELVPEVVVHFVGALSCVDTGLQGDEESSL